MPRARLRAVGVALILACLLLAGAGVATAGGWLGRDAAPPLARTVHVRIHYSHYDLTEIDVEPGQTITFVVENTDPIDHEFIVGDAQMQQAHEDGTEARHPPRPGEISIPAGETVTTTMTLPLTGNLLFGCHLPGHYSYGMRGVITIS